MNADPSRQQDILESALAQFLARGYEATSVADIARGASVSKPTVYNHFENKRALFMCVAGEVIDRVHRAFDAAELDPTAGTASLRVAATRFVRVVMDERVVNLYRLVVSDGGQTADLRSIAATLAESPAHASLEVLICSLVERGELRPCDPAEAATAFIDLAAGRLVLRAILDPWNPPGDAACRAHAERGVRRFLTLFGPGSPGETTGDTPSIVTRSTRPDGAVLPARHGPAA